MTPRRWLLWGFRPARELMGGALGPLERRVMDVFWRSGDLSVREAHARVDGALAYTTLLTTLDRLYRKGLLDRRKAGRLFVYSPICTREEFESAVAAEAVAGLLAGGRSAPQPLLSHLVDAVSSRDVELLDELERLVREKRRQLRRSRQ